MNIYYLQFLKPSEFSLDKKKIDFSIINNICMGRIISSYSDMCISDDSVSRVQY